MTLKHASNRWRYMNRKANYYASLFLMNFLSMSEALLGDKGINFTNDEWIDLIGKGALGKDDVIREAQEFENNIVGQYNSFKWFHNKAKELADEYGFTDKDMEG